MMNLFQMTTNAHGIERKREFLNDNFVCIGWPGIGDLTNISADELQNKLEQTYPYSEAEMSAALAAIHCFVHTMQDGDYVLIADGDWVHLGDLGDYFYYEVFDTPEDGKCHRRGVTWLKSLPRDTLNAGVQKWFAVSEPISQYKGPLPSARLDLWITAGTAPEANQLTEQGHIQVDEGTLAEALNILKQALRSEDAERRERAAIALLNYAK